MKQYSWRTIAGTSPSFFPAALVVQDVGFTPIINVKDYGALGNGVHDDTSAIQAALDTAFGPWNGTQHGNANKALNQPVYFPGGNYIVTSPLYLVNIIGGLIFGAGQGSTTISYGGSFAGGNAINGNSFVPIFMMHGFAYSSMRDLSLVSTHNASNLGVGIYIWQNPPALSPPSYTQTQVLFENMSISADTGIMAGYDATNPAVECSECQYVGVTFGNCTFSGLTIGASNALNHSIYGGGAFSCGRGYYCQSENVSLICNASMAGNTVADIVSAGAGAGTPMVVLGCRTESTNFLSIAANQIHVSGCEQAVSGGSFLASSSATAILDACSGSSGSPCVITGTGNLYKRGCSGITHTGYTGTVAQNI